MDTFISFIIEIKHLWFFLGVVLAAWVVMQPIKMLYGPRFQTYDHTFFSVINYLISAGMLFYVWPGDFKESTIAATILAYFVPKIHRLLITAVGKKWPWARTILTGERKTHEEDIITGDDKTVWLGKAEVEKLIKEKMKEKEITERREQTSEDITTPNPETPENK